MTATTSPATLRATPLHTARFEGAGLDAYGGEAVAEQLAALALDGPHLASARTLVQFGGDDEGAAALWIEKAPGGEAARVWFVSSSAVRSATPAGWAKLDVPRDTDLAQAGPRLRHAPAEHADAPDDLEARLASVWPSSTAALGLKRPRPLVFRTARSGADWAALVRIEGEAGQPARPVGVWAVFGGVGEETFAVADHVGLRSALLQPWTPRL